MAIEATIGIYRCWMGETMHSENLARGGAGASQLGIINQLMASGARRRTMVSSFPRHCYHVTAFVLFVLLLTGMVFPPAPHPLAPSAPVPVTYAVSRNIAASAIVTAADEDIILGAVELALGQPQPQPLSSTGIPTVYLNLRAGPSTTYWVLTTLAPGTPLTIHEEQNGWFFISTSTGATGWVYGIYVHIPADHAAAPMPSTAGTFVSGSLANIRSGPSTSDRISSTLTYGTPLQPLAQHNGWYKVQASNGTVGWIAGWLVNIPPAVAESLPFETVAPSMPAPNSISFPREQMRATLDAAGGTFGAIVYDPITGTQVYAQNADQVFSAASVIKLPIVLTVYHLAQQGQLDLNEQLTLQAADLTEGSGSIQYNPIGTTYSIRELCSRMLWESDNTASNMILKRIGFAPVNALMEQLGAYHTRVQRLILDLDALQAGYDNQTSPADMLLLLRVLEQGVVTGTAGAQEILTAMQQNIWRTRLPALLPPGVVVAHKTGTLYGNQHDAGIVYLPDRRYMIVIMGRDLADYTVGNNAIAQASLLVYTWFTQ